MNEKAENLARNYFRRQWDDLTRRERRVIESLINRSNVSHDVRKEFEDARTFGERVADKVATFGGSWTFIFIFGGILFSWIIINSLILMTRAFDPYPYILLNLFLSMLAAIQAPIIMMSQNRQAAHDRLDAAHDYEVNLKAELEIRSLEEKITELRERNWAELIEIQQKQLALLEELLAAQKKTW
ncbi:MAG: DUF1003 domain-containing protein [Pyrinomonadaceae bacterium]